MKQRPDFVTVEAELNHGQRKPVVLFNDTEVLSELDFDAMAKMSRENVRSTFVVSFEIKTLENETYRFFRTGLFPNYALFRYPFHINECSTSHSI